MYKTIEVKTKGDIKRFIHFPMELYKDSPYYVPLLVSDEKKIFKKDYVYNNTCHTKFFLCVDENDKVVGRIEGIIQNAANEKWGQKRVRFTRFDAINDQEVANQLLDAVVNWAKPYGMTELVGPLGYSDMEREGLLIDGFDKIQTYEEQYNYDYYQKLLENYGLGKDVDWVEYKVFPPKTIDPRFEALCEKVIERHKLTIYQPKSMGKFIKEYQKDFFEIVDITYNKIYGTVPFTKEMMESSIQSFKLILRPQDLVVVFNEQKKVIAFALVFPSISKIVTKHKGRITLPFLFEFLRNKKHPEILDMGLIGVIPEYMMTGGASVAVYALMKQIIGKGIEHMETNLMLETNTNILGLMSNFQREYTKKRRCFVKSI